MDDCRLVHRTPCGSPHRVRRGLARTTGEDVVQQTAMAKTYATEMAGRVVDRAVQIHGAAGVSDETILERCYRDVRPMRIYEGSGEANEKCDCAPPVAVRQ